MFIKYRNDDKLREWQEKLEKQYYDAYHEISNDLEPLKAKYESLDKICYSLHDKYRVLHKLSVELEDRVQSLETYVSRLEDIMTELLLKQGLEAVDVPEHIELIKIKR